MLRLKMLCRPRAHTPLALRIAFSIIYRRNMSSHNQFLRISEEVRDAVERKLPVVALETTIYTHGFPFPDNLDLARRLEQLVRKHGGIPATIGILDGLARVGMSDDELQLLLKDHSALKVSRRDIGFLVGSALRQNNRLNGGTTISGTMVLAHLAGIKVFATGGLGGVHRGGENSMDVSADLTEFARTPIAVISSGCKGFLDIPRTLEYLETQGAAVATFADGRQGKIDFPAFWCRDSGVKSPMVVQDESEAAAMIYAQNTLPLSSGQFFANPVPEEFGIPLEEMDAIIKQALIDADEAGATGNANTPFVLEAIRKHSGGRSIPANVALIEGNVVRGSKVAVELSKLERRAPTASFSDASWGANREFASGRSSSFNDLPKKRFKGHSQEPVDILVAGSLALDLSCDYSPSTQDSTDISPRLRTSNPCVISSSIGGVGHNIANAIRYSGANVRLCSAVADDAMGKSVIDEVSSSGMDITGIQALPSNLSTGTKTAQYVSVNDTEKNLVMGMGDMRILESSSGYFNEDIIAAYIKNADPKWMVVDSNWDTATLRRWVDQGKAAGVSVAYEPVAAAKSTKLFDLDMKAANFLTCYPNVKVDLATPNIHELRLMHAAARSAEFFDRGDWWQIVDFMGISSAGARAELVQATSAELVNEGVPQMSIQLLPFIPCILTKLGSGGVLLTQLLSANDERLRSPAAAPYILSRANSEGANELDVGGIYLRHFKAVEVMRPEETLSVNGAGDTFMGFLMARLATQSGLRVEDAVDLAQRASVLTLKSAQSVNPEISKLIMA